MSIDQTLCDVSFDSSSMSDGNNFAREYSCKQTSDACLHAEMVTSSEMKTFLSSNVFDVRPDLWSTDFCLQKSSSFCSPLLAEDRGSESWRDLL